MNKIFFIDCETLSVRDNAVILSVGMTWITHEDVEKVPSFLALMKRGFYKKLNRKEQVAKARDIQDESLEWWKGQSEEAKRVLKSDNCISFDEFYQCLKNYLIDNEYDLYSSHLWSKSCKDYYWINTLFNDFEAEPLFLHKNVRDSITAWDLLRGDNIKPIEVNGKIEHNALHDACDDALKFLQLLK